MVFNVENWKGILKVICIFHINSACFIAIVINTLINLAYQKKKTKMRIGPHQHAVKYWEKICDDSCCINPVEKYITRFRA